jgi:beta-glucosidase
MVKTKFLWSVVGGMMVLGACGLAQGTALDDRVEGLLAQMTLEEKLNYIGGSGFMNVRAIPRLGVPALLMSDGPVGTRTGSSTAYPGGIALAATWNVDLAARFGTSLSRDDRARGVHIHLMPGLNIYRSPLCGRNFEYFGEDPYLASRMVVPLVKNLQAGGVLGTAKHFAANNQEYDRNRISSNMDERTLREIYLPAFRAAVMEGGVGCVMNAYNPLNGVYCTENNFLNNVILKGDWGFDGILMSDWGATHSTVAAANAGLDLEMPSGANFSPTALGAALNAGTVSMATIDDKVRRILRAIVRMGFLDHAQLDPSIPLDDPASSAVARDMAREAMVLLKNTGHLLPLDRSHLRSVVVLGPNAGPGVPAGGGSANVTPYHTVSQFDGILAAAGNDVEVMQVPGVSYANSEFEYVDANGLVHPGLQAEYFANKTLAGTPQLKRVDSHINFNWGSASPAEGLPSDGFSVRWTGRIRATSTGVYLFQARSEDGIRITLNGTSLMADWTDHTAKVLQAKKPLRTGLTYDLKVEYYNSTGPAIAQVGWSLNTADVTGQARLADVAVVCVGFDASSEKEGSDRPFALPDAQVDLIKTVAAANPNTIVVINSGGGVDMRPWLDAVPTVIQGWYPGQEGGTALGEILFGDVNPSGKLPATFEKRWEDNPSYAYYQSTDGVAIYYTEGVFVGYRGYDQNQIEPQFCFGHGLSYTTFGYSDLVVPPTLVAGQAAEISFVVRNTGDRSGSEVCQLYISDLVASVPRPPKELKGFAKVALAPGESRVVTMSIDQDRLSFFDVKSGRFTAEPGTFRVQVGASSRDLRLTGQFELLPSAP